LRFNDALYSDCERVSKFGNVQMGVNMRLTDERDLAGIELRYPDGRTWPGKGGFDYVRETRIIGQ
jgi:hypothetical protein